ncbi:tyrosine-type recombinase/integrase [Mycobacterium intracellulare]|uniref:tyrosine-type recombinase/integrase n=1 Tax=Mycobacterium intracellulare TaxID=1767 RepID=UPI001F41E7C5|nr:site-specific integrase [Mycobacterium intracellulare]
MRGETLADFGKRWIAHRNIKDSTRALYADQFEKHIEPALGQIPIAALTLDDVNRWHAKLLPGKARVRSQTYGLLRAICGSAVEADLLTKNPCAIKGAGNTNRKREPVLLSVAELAAVAEAIKPERFKAFVLISGWGAMRFGEVIELRRKDISDGCETITVARGAYHLKGCHVGPTKSGKSRVVVLPPHIRADVKHHLDTFVDPNPNALLFPTTRSGCHLAQNVFREAFAKACKSVGREGVNVHALRHFGATMAARVGATPAEVQARLGHSTFKAAMAYQHSEATRQHEIAAALSAMAEQ